MKKKLLSLWLLGVLLFGISSCSDDDGPIIIGPQPIEEEEILITDESGATLVNTKDIVLGESEDDVVFEMTSTLLAASGSKLQVNIVNDGTINVSQSGSRRFFVAEAGFVAQPAAATAACDIKLGRWRTALRDFSQTRDLFLGRGVKMDFSGGELFLTRSEDCVDGTAYSVAPAALLHNAGGDPYVYECLGYQTMAFSAADEDADVLEWDQSDRTVSLYSNK